MSRIATFALALALSVVAVPAFAQSTSSGAPGQNNAMQLSQNEKKADKKFPMTAGEFRDHVGARQEKARAKMEAHIAKKQLPADKADEARARFNLNAAKINAKVDEVCADGTVTKEEAESVRALAKSLHPHHKHEKKQNPA